MYMLENSLRKHENCKCLNIEKLIQWCEKEIKMNILEEKTFFKLCKSSKTHEFSSLWTAKQQKNIHSSKQSSSNLLLCWPI